MNMEDEHESLSETSGDGGCTKSIHFVQFLKQNYEACSESYGSTMLEVLDLDNILAIMEEEDLEHFDLDQ